MCGADTLVRAKAAIYRFAGRRMVLVQTFLRYPSGCPTLRVVCEGREQTSTSLEDHAPKQKGAISRASSVLPAP